MHHPILFYCTVICRMLVPISVIKVSIPSSGARHCIFMVGIANGGFCSNCFVMSLIQVAACIYCQVNHNIIQVLHSLELLPFLKIYLFRGVACDVMCVLHLDMCIVAIMLGTKYNKRSFKVTNQWCVLYRKTITTCMM